MNEKKITIRDLIFRRTGRTQRMLDDLERAVSEGHYCFVICASEGHREGLMFRFRDQIGGVVAHHKVYPSCKKPGGVATFEVPTQGDVTFDYHAGVARGAQPGCKYFMDHYTFEQILHCYNWALEQWVKYSYPDDTEEKPERSPIIVGVDFGFKSRCPWRCGRCGAANYDKEGCRPDEKSK